MIGHSAFKRISCVAVAGILLLVTAAIASRSHWWKKQKVSVTSDGRTIADANVYLAGDGRILVDLRTVPNEVLYIIDPRNQRVGIPDAPNFYALPGYLFSVGVHPPLSLRWEGEIGPLPVIEQRSLEFTSGTKHRVRVSW